MTIKDSTMYSIDQAIIELNSPDSSLESLIADLVLRCQAIVDNDPAPSNVDTALPGILAALKLQKVFTLFPPVATKIDHPKYDDLIHRLEIWKDGDKRFSSRISSLIAYLRLRTILDRLRSAHIDKSKYHEELLSSLILSERSDGIMTALSALKEDQNKLISINSTLETEKEKVEAHKQSAFGYLEQTESLFNATNVNFKKMVRWSSIGAVLLLSSFYFLDQINLESALSGPIEKISALGVSIQTLTDGQDHLSDRILQSAKKFDKLTAHIGYDLSKLHIQVVEINRSITRPDAKSQGPNVRVSDGISTFGDGQTVPETAALILSDKIEQLSQQVASLSDQNLKSNIDERKTIKEMKRKLDEIGQYVYPHKYKPVPAPRTFGPDPAPVPPSIVTSPNTSRVLAIEIPTTKSEPNAYTKSDKKQQDWTTIEEKSKPYNQYQTKNKMTENKSSGRQNRQPADLEELVTRMVEKQTASLRERLRQSDDLMKKRNDSDKETIGQIRAMRENLAGVNQRVERELVQ